MADVSDDESGWNDVLVDGWGPLVRAAVVGRVERAMTGRRGVLVRTVADPDGARYAWTELLHHVVVAAIRAETGANLDELGSQAAWACYDDTWDLLRQRWGSGGDLQVVAPGQEAAVLALLRGLSPAAAEHAGVDIGREPPQPLRTRAGLLVDVDGLFAYVARATVPITDLERRRIDQLVHRVRRG